jgi:hypothetical protein
MVALDARQDPPRFKPLGLRSTPVDLRPMGKLEFARNPPLLAQHDFPYDADPCSVSIS